MRLGVLDVGSNTVHLLIVDARYGALPWAAHSDKTELRLIDHLDARGRLDHAGVDALAGAVAHAAAVARRSGVEQLMAFATSAVREARNGDGVLDEIAARTGVRLQVLSGEEEAALTFLAVRRWYGWSAGRLLVVDIGGGSLELATGIDSEPDGAASLPLGAARLTREAFTGDPPPARQLRALRKGVKADLARSCGPLRKAGPHAFAVGSSKTFKQLARIAGAAPSSEGPYARRMLTRPDLTRWIAKMAGMSAAERAQLPGVSAGRAPQLLAGAVVAEAVMAEFDVTELTICPWALREGLILRRLDQVDGQL